MAGGGGGGSVQSVHKLPPQCLHFLNTNKNRLPSVQACTTVLTCMMPRTLKPLIIQLTKMLNPYNTAVFNVSKLDVFVDTKL